MICIEKTCWNCKFFNITRIENNAAYALYDCNQFGDNVYITDPKWQKCKDFILDSEFKEVPIDPKTSKKQ